VQRNATAFRLPENLTAYALARKLFDQRRSHKTQILQNYLLLRLELMDQESWMVSMQRSKNPSNDGALLLAA
jgi:hypothetical protein